MNPEESKLAKLQRRAKIIAQMINKENTDTRGTLFHEIAIHLDDIHTQHYTAKLFYEMAKIYGRAGT